MYFLLLDGFVPPVKVVPLCVPVPVIRYAENSLRLIRISVRPLLITKFRSSSVGSVCDHPYLSLCDTDNPLVSAAVLKRLLW